MAVREDQLVRLPLSAPWLERVKSSVNELLRTESRELQNAGLLAASELAENILKFGRPTSDAPEGSVSISVRGDELRIGSENGASPERSREVAQLLDRIASCANRELLYVERLNAMLRGRGGDAHGFGLIRIAHEGSFALSCRYEEPKLTIVATRKLR
jgi:hypothetical protein